MKPQYRTLDPMESSILNPILFRILNMKRLQERFAHIYKMRPDLEGKNGQIGIVRASGASKSLVNQWVNGVQESISIESALQIEANLGFSHIWLMTGIGDPLAKPGQVVMLPPSAPAEPLMTLATPKELELLDLFRRSTDDGQLDIFRMAAKVDKRPAAQIRRGKA